MADAGRWGWEQHWPTDSDLLERAVRNAGSWHRPRWSHVADKLAVGSSVAIALCQRFGLDPEEIKKRAR